MLGDTWVLMPRSLRSASPALRLIASVVDCDVLVRSSAAVAAALPIDSFAEVALLMIVLLSAPALRLSDTVASAALRFKASVAAVLAAALLPSASVVFAATWLSARSAAAQLVLMDSES